MKKAEIAEAFRMIESNKRAKSMIQKAFEVLNKERIDRTTDDSRNYQEEVRRRLRDKKLNEEKQMEYNVQYMASMLPSAMGMHQFIKVMKKDQVFESARGYKIVSQIRKNKDKERLEYLLTNKLSAT